MIVEYEKWLKLFSDKLEIQISDIGLIHFGGKGNLKHFNPEIIKKIARKSIFVVDSDKNSEDSPVEKWIELFATNCKRIGIHCWITKRKEIENYIPIDVLKETLHIFDDTFQLLHYDDVFMKLEEKRKKIGKIKLARKVSDVLSLVDIKNDDEFYDALKEEMIDILNSFLCA